MGWWIALAVFVLILWLPLGATARYNADGFSVKVIAGPLRIPVFPSGKKAGKGKKEKKSGEKKKHATAQNKQPDTATQDEKGGPVTDFLPVVKTVLDLLNAFRKKLRIHRLDLKWTMAGDDPCDLAINYGKAWAAVGNLMPQIERCFVIQKRNIEVACDFESSQSVIVARIDLSITLGRLLGILIWYGVRAIMQIISIQNKRKGGKKV
jgi:hypothetical protein